MANPFSQVSKGGSGYAWLASDAESRSIDPRSYLSGDTAPPLQLEPQDESPSLPPEELNKRAFYPSMLENDPENFKANYNQAAGELRVSGESSLYNKHKDAYVAEQHANAEDDVNNILLDPTINNETKLKVLDKHRSGGLVSDNLEDKYIQQSANQEHDTISDSKSQDLMLQTTVDTVNAHRKFEEIRQDALAVESGSGWGNVIFGIVRDIPPGFLTADNWYIRQKLAEHLGEKWTDHTAGSILFPGSTNKEIGVMLDNILKPEEKIKFIQSIINAETLIPGTSYNIWSQLQDKINQGDMGPIETFIENTIGWMDVFGISKILRNPIKAAKWFKYQKMSDGERKFFQEFIMPSNLDKIGKSINAEEFSKAQRAKEEATATQNNIASNPQTGSMIATPLGEPVQQVVPPSQLIKFGVNPVVSPTSPIGMTQTVNPTKTRELGTQGVIDPELAKAAGTTPGEIAGSFAFEKYDDDFLKNNSDIAKDLDDWDKVFNKRYDDTTLDPYIVDTVERTKDKEKIYRTFQETQGAHYQASNSYVSESLGVVEGRARFGKNSDFGFNTMEEAITAENNIKINFPDNTTSVIQEFNQFYVDMKWKKEYDPFSSRMFGVESADARIFGIPLSSLARSSIAKFIWPSTARLDEWVPKGAFTSSVQGMKTQEIFGKLQKEISNTELKPELHTILTHVSETQTYMKEGDIAAKFPYLGEASRKELMHKQYLWKKLADYEHNFVNRLERRRLQSENMQGIWKDDKYLGNGKVLDQIPNVKTIYSFGDELAIPMPKNLDGKQIVKLDSPMDVHGQSLDYAIVDGRATIGVLPDIVVPKIEGYVPRFNAEPWYVKVHPKSKMINGERVSDINILRDKHTKTLGAAKNEKEAIQLTKKLQDEMGDDFVVSHVRERADTGDAIITDFKVYKEKTDYGKKRGDRLPTIDGFARLEDPFVSMTKRINTLARLDAWKDYDEVFKKNFLNRFAPFLPRGEFPNIIHDLKIPQNATEDMVKSFNVAQRMFEQYSNSKYKLTISDTAWKIVGHKIADLLEKLPTNIPSEWVREISNKGDVFRRGLSSLSTNLFINLNPFPQFLVQTQVVLPFAMMEKGFRDTMHMLPGLYLNMLSRANEAKPYSKIINKVGHDVAGKPSEFQKIADAIYEAGIPQSVDLNMMLSGSLEEISKPLVQGFGGKVVEGVGQVISKPGQIGKAIGYSPAQMTADMAGFLFAKARWERLNPGKNWNTPTNIRQIAADGWDIMGSMSTRASSMPYQDGYIHEVFRFASILHKNISTVFSSKTLRKAPGELIDPKVKFATANMAMFGVYGVPAGTLIYNGWNMFFGDETDPDKLAEYEKYKGGLIDSVVNATLEMMFHEKGDSPLDLAVAKRIGPMPDTLPYVDVGWSLYKFMTGQKTENPRFPFVNAVGSIWDAVRDTNNLLSARGTYSTPEALMVFGNELAESTSGFNNFGKALAIAEFDDKTNKFGQHLGLELTRSHMVAQIFGIQSKKELNIYEMLENKKEREDYIESRATQILKDMEKFKDKIGTPDWEEYVHRLRVLNDGTHERVQDEVAQRVMQKDRAQYLTTRESMMKYLAQHYKGQNDRNLNQMLASFKNGTPKEQEFIKWLERNMGIIEE